MSGVVEGAVRQVLSVQFELLARRSAEVAEHYVKTTGARFVDEDILGSHIGVYDSAAVDIGDCLGCLATPFNTQGRGHGRVVSVDICLEVAMICLSQQKAVAPLSQNYAAGLMQ